jgi:hypothetical protein
MTKIVSGVDLMIIRDPTVRIVVERKRSLEYFQ